MYGRLVVVSVDESDSCTVGSCRVVVDIVLCFVECRGVVVTAQHEREVRAFADQIYNVGQKHIIIHVLDDSTMTADHMIYLMHELSHALRYSSDLHNVGECL